MHHGAELNFEFFSTSKIQHLPTVRNKRRVVQVGIPNCSRGAELNIEILSFCGKIQKGCSLTSSAAHHFPHVVPAKRKLALSSVRSTNVKQQTSHLEWQKKTHTCCLCSGFALRASLMVCVTPSISEFTDLIACKTTLDWSRQGGAGRGKAGGGWVEVRGGGLMEGGQAGQSRDWVEKA